MQYPSQACVITVLICALLLIFVLYKCRQAFRLYLSLPSHPPFLPPSLTHTLTLSQVPIIQIHGHQFVEISYHTPSNCDVCNKGLPWSLNFLGKGKKSYKCKRKPPHCVLVSVYHCWFVFVGIDNAYTILTRVTPPLCNLLPGKRGGRGTTARNCAKPRLCEELC